MPIAEGILLLRCLGKLAYLFGRSQGISSHLETIWCARCFPQFAVLNLVFLWTWDGFLKESLELPKGSQANCRV